MQITYGDQDTFAAMTYGNVSSRMVDYVANEFQRAQQLLTTAGDTLLYKAQQSFEEFRNSDAFRVARAALHSAMSMWGRNEIQSIREVWRLQHAPMVMHRWVMANPVVRKLYHQQQCDGYSETYVDVQPGKIGEDHDDWRRVMDGFLTREGDELYFNNYSTDNECDEDELSFEQQVDIRTAWLTAEVAIANNVDPTSRREEDLG